MFKQFVIILLVFTISSVFPYMAREYYEYKGSTKIAHKIPYRTLLLNWKEYLRNITNEFVYEIEDFGLCNFYLDDYTQNISRNFFGYEVKGLVNYTNGFMGTLQEIQIQDDMEMSWIDETTMTSYLRSKFIINDIILYFDFNAILTKTNFGGTVAIPLESIEFEMKVIKSYKTNEVTGVIYNANAKYPRNTRWYFEPSNAYTDIFNRDVKWSFYDDLQRLTNTTIKTLLNKVVQKQKYPDICLSCNEGMQLYEYKKEYDDDHANILKERENNRIKFKVQSPQIEYRTALVNWIKDIAFKKNLDNLSIHLAVYILDIFMDDYNIKIDKLQLIALVTLLLATKYEERDSNILKASEINGLVKNKYLLSEYHDMEICILKHLNWNMNFTTVVHFVNIYVEFLLSHEEISNLSLVKSISDVSSAVRNIIQIYMDYVMDDLILMHELPSKVAAAIMACTRMNLRMTTIYPPQLLCISRYRLFELKVLIGRLKSGVRHKIVAQ